MALNRTSLLLTLLLFPPVLGCTLTDTERRDWSGYQGPGSEYFQRTELERFSTMGDPAEPMNRFFSIVNHGFMVGFVDPLSKGYRLLVPEPGRRAFGRLGDNLAWPKRLVNNLLQGEFADAGTETARFLINTTIGIVGLFDPACHWFGIEGEKEETAETFEQWGWEGDTYLVLPFLGPGSEQETPASFFDMALDPASYVPGLSTVLKFNEGTDEIDNYKRFVRTNYDPYSFARYLWSLNRRSKIRDFEYSSEATAESETLSAVFLKHQDEEFPDELEEGDVTIPHTDESLSYTYIMQEAPAPIVYILPGLGGHRESDSCLGLLEMAYNAGYSAVSISSTMNFEFMQNGSSVDVPGYGPVDARDSHVALDLIHKDLNEEFPGRIKGTALLGISLGAHHALRIAAAATDPKSKLIKFDRYLPINPPISLLEGVERLDEYFNAPLEWPEENRERLIKNTIMKVMKLRDANGAPTASIPMNRLEARFLIGMTYRIALMFVIHDSQSRNNMGVLLTDLSGPSRGPAYDEIFEYSYMEYIYAFVLPYFQGRDKSIRTARDLLERSDLRAISKQLRDADGVRLFATRNDFLLDEQDYAWMQETFGKRLTLWETGGHLGNLFNPEIQASILAELADLAKRR